jgi:hypothetical protein
MHWRSLLRSNSKSEATDVSDSKAWNELIRLVTSDAMRNRVALSPETLRLHVRMVAAPFKTSDVTEGYGEAGYLLAELLTLLAAQVGRPAPNTPQSALKFLKGQLRGFDTPEAVERREGAWLEEVARILKGSGPG